MLSASLVGTELMYIRIGSQIQGCLRVDLKAFFHSIIYSTTAL